MSHVNPLGRYPHIYKKGKILNFKILEEGDKSKKTYFFGSSNPTLNNIHNQCNNMNQVLARTILGISKLLSYFDLSPDFSEKHSKSPSVFNKFFKLFNKGECKDLEPLLKKISERLDLIEPKIENVKPEIEKLRLDIEKLKPSQDEKPINRDEVLDFTNRLREIQQKLVDILGA